MSTPATSTPGLYARTPMFVRIVIGLIAGLITGLIMKEQAVALKPISSIVLELLRLLATPLVFFAITLSLLRTNIGGKSGLRLGFLILTNTLMAIIIGLAVVNLLQPGAGAPIPSTDGAEALSKRAPFNVVNDLLAKILPTNFIAPFLQNEMLPLIVIAISGGIALRIARSQGHTSGVAQVESLMDTLFHVILIMLHWLFHLVPFAVLAVVASTVGREGFAPFRSMGKFVLAVLLALSLQAAFYLIRMRRYSWVTIPRFFAGARDALVTAFSTASSTATLPITMRCATDKLRLRQESASMGVIVGGNMNNDGTALYEAMAALFVAQMLGLHLGFTEQLTVVFMAIIASVGAAGIPEAGLVTMMAVFSAVKLPIEYIPMLLTVDWFLDRCRTAINVWGDLTVASVLDGKTPEHPEPADRSVAIS